MRLFEVSLSLLTQSLLEELSAQKQKRADFIKKTLGSQWHGLQGFADLDAFIERLAEVDPSPNGQFMPWMAKLIIQAPDTNRPEDLARVADDLKNWERFKSQMASKDINAYKSFQSVYDAVAPFLKPRKKTKDEKAKEREEAKIAALKNDIVTVYNGAEGWIRIPMSQAAACYLGQQTRWCTAAKNNNMFNSYNNRDRMFVVYDKAQKERYQLHIESGQFADASDKMIGMNAVPKWAQPHIVNWYKLNNPDLSLAHLMTLGKMDKSAQLIAPDHEHAGLLDLMNKYGV